MIKRVQKLWGYEEWLVNEPEYCLKRLWLNPGFQCSLHYHPIKKETFIVSGGTVVLEQRDVRGFPYEETLKPQASRTILPKTPHRFRNTTDCLAIIYEVSTHHDDNDVVRIEDSRKI